MALLLESINGLIATGEVGTEFQPIVSLVDGQTVGLEALSRGPAGHRLERPDAMFAAAADAGQLAELDALCLRTAFATAHAGGLAAPATLFVTSSRSQRTSST